MLFYFTTFLFTFNFSFTEILIYKLALNDINILPKIIKVFNLEKMYI